MKLRFRQSREDLIDLSRNSLKQNKLLKFYAVIIIAVLVINGGVFFSRKGINFEDLLSWVVPIVLIVIIWYFAIKVYFKKRLESSGNKKMMTGDREIELDKKEIRLWTPQSETTYQWSAISKVSSSAKNYFLYLGSAQAVIVSKSAFKSATEEEQFLNLLKEKGLWK